MRGVLVDTHTHYFHKRFDSGREEIISRLLENNVIAVIDGAIDFESNARMKLLCEKYPHVFMAAGCHPNCVEEMNEEKLKKIAELLRWEKVVAVGETGLDYARGKSETQIRTQKEWFRKFIELSIETHKPMVIHCREANDDLISILQTYEFVDCPGVIHCFSGSLEHAEKLIDMGFYIGVSGMFTNMESDSNLCVALKEIPLERVVFETDSPYLIPKGVDGKRNTSVNLNTIVNCFSELRGESAAYVKKIVLENTKKLYPVLF